MGLMFLLIVRGRREYPPSGQMKQGAGIIEDIASLESSRFILG
jgi:hypothetical protein